MTEFLDTNIPDWLDTARDAILQDKIVAIAYERLYGLAANALSPVAVAKVAAIKSRDSAGEGNKPIAIILPSIEAASLVIPFLSPAAEKLAKRYWPGPLTLVVKALPNIPQYLVSQTGKIGIRVAGASPAALLATKCELPLTATSANRADAPDALSHNDITDIYGIDIIVRGHVLGPPGSTIVDIDDDKIKILRKGIIAIEGI